MKLEVKVYDYQEAIRAVDKLLENIHCSCIACLDCEDNLTDLPTAEQIVDKVIDKII